MGEGGNLDAVKWEGWYVVADTPLVTYSESVVGVSHHSLSESDGFSWGERGTSQPRELRGVSSGYSQRQDPCVFNLVRMPPAPFLATFQKVLLGVHGTPASSVPHNLALFIHFI